MLSVCRACAQGVPLIATSPVRHELPVNMQPTPVEVHKFAAPWNDLGGGSCSPTSTVGGGGGGADIDDIPSPRTLVCSTLPLQVTSVSYQVGVFSTRSGFLEVVCVGLFIISAYYSQHGK